MYDIIAHILGTVLFEGTYRFMYSGGTFLFLKYTPLSGMN